MSKNNIYEILTYKQFQMEIKEKLQNKLGEAYKVELDQVLKNNSIELVAIVITDEKNSISPNIYIEEYYDYYLIGIEVEEIINLIIDAHFSYLEKWDNDTYLEEFSWENIKDGIFYRIVNRDKNKRLLVDVPHLLYLDLAITFHYLVSETPAGLSVVRITKSHMKEWGIKLKELRDTAIKNTPELFPVNLRNMNDIIFDMLSNDWDDSGINNNGRDFASKWPDDLLIDIILNTKKGDNPMYVLTNSRGINGASCILYREVIHEFANDLNSNLYIIPSSIHEVAIVKDDGYISKEELIDMVIGVNELEVDQEDYLSNNVYYYDRNKDMITL